MEPGAEARPDRGSLTRIPFDPALSPPWRTRLQDALAQAPGAVVLTGLSTADNGDLLAVAHELGPVTARGTTIPGHPLEDGRVYRVEPVNDGEGVSDEAGLLIFSTTTGDFDGHTDGYHNVEPPAYVLLLCVQPDTPPFGATTVADGPGAVAALGPTTTQLLRDAVFPTSFGVTDVLSGPGDRPSVRFNMREINRFATAGDPPLDAAHHEAARELARVLADPASCWRDHLGVGECLILDNDRAVHGRSALSPGSHRLMKRVWVEPLAADAGAA